MDIDYKVIKYLENKKITNFWERLAYLIDIGYDEEESLLFCLNNNNGDDVLNSLVSFKQEFINELKETSNIFINGFISFSGSTTIFPLNTNSGAYIGGIDPYFDADARALSVNISFITDEKMYRFKDMYYVIKGYEGDTKFSFINDYIKNIDFNIKNSVVKNFILTKHKKWVK